MNDAPRTLAEWLRAAYADEAAGCPPAEVWLADELAALSHGDLQRLEAHAAGCPACSSERELAAAFDGSAGADADDVAWVAARLAAAPAAAAPGNSAGGRVVPFPGRRAVVRWVRLAAAAVLVVAAGLMFQTLHLSSPPLPEPPDRGAVRGARVEALAPLGDVPALPTELRWEPVAGAVAYRVRLFSADDTALWETTVPASPAPLPAGVMAELHRAVSYRWSVEALAADGAVLGRSVAMRFRAAAEPETPTESEP